MREKRIYIKQWMAMKPYRNQSPTDLYYLKLSNKVQKSLYKELMPLLTIHFLQEEISGLSCFLVSYFEDIVSGTNIWNAFIKKHKELYGEKLPFYETTEYFEDEINVQDVRFLIWYYATLCHEDRFVWPSNALIKEMAEVVMEVFNPEYEYAPENELLKSCYTLPEDAVFYEARELMYRIFADTYLLLPDTGLKFAEMVDEIVSEPDERIDYLLREGTDRFALSTYSKLLSLRSNEWAALVLGENHPLYEDILKISPRANGAFFYKGQDQTQIYLEHIASGKKINLAKESYQDHDKLEEGSILHIGMVKWKGEWWFSGISSIGKFDPDFVLDQKNSLQARQELNFLEDKKQIKEALSLQEKAFLDFNNGSPIAFLERNQVNGFIKDFTAHYNKSLKLSKKERKEAEERTKKDGYFGNDNEMDFGDDFEHAVVFFNPASGLEFYFDVCSAFPMEGNPFYKEEERDEDFFEMMYSDFDSKEIVQFCVDNCKEKLGFFNREHKYDEKEFDFLLRFFKNKIYHTKPQLTFTGKN